MVGSSGSAANGTTLVVVDRGADARRPPCANVTSFIVRSSVLDANGSDPEPRAAVQRREHRRRHLEAQARGAPPEFAPRGRPAAGRAPVALSDVASSASASVTSRSTSSTGRNRSARKAMSS